jgi:hypothetical protein
MLKELEVLLRGENRLLFGNKIIPPISIRDFTASPAFPREGTSSSRITCMGYLLKISE